MVADGIMPMSEPVVSARRKQLPDYGIHAGAQPLSDRGDLRSVTAESVSLTYKWAWATGFLAARAGRAL